MPYGSDEIDVGAARDERLDARDAAFARRIQQRREPARLHDLDARLGRHPPLPVVRRARAHRRRRRARAATESCRAASAPPPTSAPSGRRTLSRAFTRAPCSSSSRAASTRPVRATTISAVCPSAFARLDVGARLEQRANDLRVRLDGRRRQRRHAVVVRARRDSRRARAAPRRARDRRDAPPRCSAVAPSAPRASTSRRPRAHATPPRAAQARRAPATTPPQQALVSTKKEAEQNRRA